MPSLKVNSLLGAFLNLLPSNLIPDYLLEMMKLTWSLAGETHIFFVIHWTFHITLEQYSYVDRIENLQNYRLLYTKTHG